jgi:phenylacetate-CoA ligase
MTSVADQQTLDDVWDADAERMPRERLRSVQDERLKRQFARVFERSAILRARYIDAGITPETFGGLDDLPHLPTFTKDDLRAWRLEHGDAFGGSLCVDQDRLAIITHSSGTSGSPTISGLTEADVEHVAQTYARALYSIGLRRGDRAPLAATVLWHGAVIGYELAHRAIGAQAYRIACGTSDGARTVLEDWRDADFNVLRSYIPELEIPYLREHDLRPAEIFPHARFLYAGIDLSGPKRRLIEEAWGLPFRNTFASGDQYLIGGECSVSAPFHHVADDWTLYEVVDPATGEVLPPGSTGELVVTNLWAEGCPYIRYRLEDMATVVHEPCACGRTTARIRVLGRSAWSVAVETKRVFSTEIEDVLWAVPELLGVRYQLVRRKSQPQTTLEVRLDPGDFATLADPTEIAAVLEAAFGTPASVEWTAPDAIALNGPIKIERVVTIE